MRTHLLSCLASVSLAARIATGQPCAPIWTSPTPGGNLDGDVFGLIQLDGSQVGGLEGLVACGRFQRGSGLPINRIAHWDENAWQQMGAGFNETAYCMTIYDGDGQGPELAMLYVGGDFTSAGTVQANRIARWNGTAWEAVGAGMNSTVRAMSLYPGPSGPLLVAGGFFTTAGGSPANRMAAWDGQAWSAVGSGTNGGVRALAVRTENGQPVLYAGGDFTPNGGGPGWYIARWDGQAWSAAADNAPPGPVRAIAEYDDGNGPALYIGGSAPASGYLARLDSPSWQVIPTLNYGPVSSLLVHDPDGTGPVESALFAGGFFYVSVAAGQPPIGKIARWDGSAWSPVVGATESQDHVYALAAIDADGVGGEDPALYAAGKLSYLDVGVRGIAMATPQGWGPLGRGVTFDDYFPGQVDELEYFDPDGAGPEPAELYAAGMFRKIGGERAVRLARWDGAQWHAMDHGIEIQDDQVSSWSAPSIRVFNDGSGDALYTGGLGIRPAGSSNAYSGFAKWDGLQWTILHQLSVYALTGYDDGTGPALYGTTAAVPGKVGRWTPGGWVPLGTGIQQGNHVGNPSVNAMTVFDDDGAGPRTAGLYVGGYFEIAGGVTTYGIARWDAGGWSGMGTGVYQFASPGRVASMCAHDDGSGPALYIGGPFETVSGVPALNVARWDGTQWSAVGSGLQGTIMAMSSQTDANGPVLYAAGIFNFGGQIHALAKWDGQVWSGGGVLTSHFPYPGGLCLAAVDQGNLSEQGPGMALGGIFDSMGGVSASGFALWQGCELVSGGCYANCDGSSVHPILNVADFTCFLQEFAAGSGYANCDGSTQAPVLNVADFTCFLSAFAAGCR